MCFMSFSPPSTYMKSCVYVASNKIMCDSVAHPYAVTQCAPLAQKLRTSHTGWRCAHFHTVHCSHTAHVFLQLFQSNSLFLLAFSFYASHHTPHFCSVAQFTIFLGAHAVSKACISSIHTQLIPSLNFHLARLSPTS